MLIKIDVWEILKNYHRNDLGLGDFFEEKLVVSKFQLNQKDQQWHLNKLIVDISKFASNKKRVEANYITFVSPEIIRKPMVFWWFRGEENFINLLKFAYYQKWHFGDDP